MAKSTCNIEGTEYPIEISEILQDDGKLFTGTVYTNPKIEFKHFIGDVDKAIPYFEPKGLPFPIQAAIIKCIRDSDKEPFDEHDKIDPEDGFVPGY